jgi:hypothetical protein
MRRLLAVLLLLPALALADVYTFTGLKLGKGYVGPITVDVTWASGAARDVTGATGTLTLWSTPPTNGVGGVVLWTKTLTPAGTPTNRMSCDVTALNTARPGSYYCEISISEAGVVDVLHAVCQVEGR